MNHCDTPVGGPPGRQGLYDPSLEHDACGVGFVAHIKNKKSHDIVRQGLRILENLTHRGATGYDPLLGDGAGILIQIPDAFLREETAKLGMTLPAAGDYACGMVFLPQSANGTCPATIPAWRKRRRPRNPLCAWCSSAAARVRVTSPASTRTASSASYSSSAGGWNWKSGA